MVVWTDAERAAITGIFKKLDYDVVGLSALGRCLIVYPWTRRYFATFGNLFSADSIMGNPKVAAHGKVVLMGLEMAVKNMENIKNSFGPLSALHSEKLNVDPDNFRLLADCITIVVGAQMGSAFTADVQAAWQKFLAIVVSALSRQYH